MKQPIIPKGDFFYLVFLCSVCQSIFLKKKKTMKVTERFGKFSGFFDFIETQKW